MIRVTFENSFFGKDVYWEGHEKDIEKIKNPYARWLAEEVKSDGVSRALGMWTVEHVDD